MKNKCKLLRNFFLMLPVLLSANLLVAQLDSTIYGVSRESTGIKFAKINVTTGEVSDISSAMIAPGIALAGACLNPYNNSFTFFGNAQINTIDISTGSSIYASPISNPSGPSYFEYPIFNNSDSTIYGLARRNYFDSTLMTNIGSIHFSSIDPSTGIINQISSSSIGAGIAINTGYTVDPFYKIFYYSDASNVIKGIDMYTGSIYSTTPLTLPYGNNIANMIYNCNDFNLYGLLTNIFYDTIISPDSLILPMPIIDSSSLQLVRINQSTGVVSIISTGSVGTIYNIGAGATIDPINNIYYFQTPGRLTGVSLLTGNIVHNEIINNTSGAPYFDLMRHYQNCYYADSRRANTTAVNDLNMNINISLSPNPSSNEIVIQCDALKPAQQITIVDMMGNTMLKETYQMNTPLNISLLSQGQYVIQLSDENGSSYRCRFMKN